MNRPSESLLPPTELRDRLAQLLVIRIGSNLPPIVRAEEDFARVTALLEANSVGGLLLFNATWPSIRETLQRLQEKSALPLLVASDIERGAGQQIAGLTLFPHQRAFVDLPDAEAQIVRYCRRTAQEARAAGVHITFGPVADVNSNPKNPIIATRAFGDDPTRAAELVTYYIRAAEAAGLLTTAKHFPGHGDTQQDSHDTSPRVAADVATLAGRELPPFRAAIEAGCSLVMTAHVEYPALDSTGTPATLSRPILVDLLRGELGFSGVVVSDSLLMAGVRDRFDTEGELAVAALNAGVDLLLDVADPAAVLDTMLHAIDQGMLTEERVDEAFERVWLLKQRTLAHSESLSPPNTSLAEGHAEAEQIARAATQVLSSTPGRLPLDPKKPLTALLLKPHHRSTDPPEQPLAAALRARFESVRYFEVGPKLPDNLIDQLLAETNPSEPILVAMIVKPAAWHAFGLVEEQHLLITELLERRKILLACLGVKNAMDAYPSADTYLTTHSDVPASQQALAEALITVP